MDENKLAWGIFIMIEEKEIICNHDSTFKFTIIAPCGYRFPIYSNFLQISFDNLIRDYGTNVFVKKALSSSQLWQSLTEFLDNQVIRYLENYFLQVRATYEIIPQKENVNSERIQLIIKNYHKRFTNEYIKKLFDYSQHTADVRIENYSQYMQQQSIMPPAI
jgi:hypothetical protein